MPHTDLKAMYQLMLTHDELRLVLLALAGKLQDQQDLRGALALNVHICHQRAKSLNTAAEIANKALDSAVKLEQTGQEVRDE